MVISATDAAKWFLQNNLDVPRNTFDGNMKLQKMLYFSQLIHLAKNGEPLFGENILAFKNGSVVEEVRQAYQYQHYELLAAARQQSVDYTPEQLETFRIAENIYGQLSAKKLSEINHMHQSWISAFENSQEGRFYNKEKSIMPLEGLLVNEVPMTKEMLNTYSNYTFSDKYEVVNGIKFYYNPEEIALTADVMALLESFNGPDSAYSVYRDETAGIVIY
ncbi:type II toxin-antitoxin system antitoxin SocA domain-containing protein [Paenibacillus filicis]|uniref:Type II toxin-antitoxin system antitoxin SocA domain-containing protein n=1 Tax=Paenibacillus filicis TaxID=669464 RepID=A0ABU9DJF8_9BACL